MALTARVNPANLTTQGRAAVVGGAAPLSRPLGRPRAPTGRIVLRGGPRVQQDHGKTDQAAPLTLS
jgi:hypothetical protein